MNRVFPVQPTGRAVNSDGDFSPENMELNRRKSCAISIADDDCRPTSAWVKRNNEPGLATALKHTHTHTHTGSFTALLSLNLNESLPTTVLRLERVCALLGRWGYSVSTGQRDTVYGNVSTLTMWAGYCVNAKTTERSFLRSVQSCVTDKISVNTCNKIWPLLYFKITCAVF